MSSIQDRIFKLAQENLELGRDPDWDMKLADSDVSSMDAVAFIKLLGHEFNIEVPATDLGEIDTMRALANYVASRAG